MAKTLVVAEKPSVARDLASTLPGSFKQSKDKTHLETQDGSTDNGGYIVTWAVGHLVGLAPPDEYDPKLKKWRFADLPILPEKFKLIPNDERAGKQLRAIHRLMADDQVDQIVNACDAGREGELIFAYVYDLAPVQKPVQRLWLSSMTKTAIREAFEHLRPAEELHSLEEAARSRSEADWLVGMNATRAASIRLRAAFDGAVSLGRVQTPTLALVARREEEIRNFVPEPYWLVEAQFEATGERRYAGRYLGGKRLPSEDEAQAIVAAVTGQAGEITKLEKTEQREQPQLLYDLTSLQRHANSLYGFSARRTLAAAQRLYEDHKALTYPRTNSRFLTGDMIPEIKPTTEHIGAQRRSTRRRRSTCSAWTSCRSAAWSTTPRSRTTTRSSRRTPSTTSRRWVRRGQGLRPRRKALPRRLPSRGGLRAHARGDDGSRATCSAPVGRRLDRGRLARPCTASCPSRTGSDDDSGGDQLLPRLEQGEGVQTREVEWMRKETQPPRRFSDASLLGAMETAGKEVDDAELREAMKDSGHRHAGHARVDHRAARGRGLHRARRPRARGHGEGHPGDPAARRAPAHLARADRQLGAPAAPDRAGPGHAPGVHGRHQEVHDRDRPGARQAEGRPDRAGQAGPVPDLRPRDHGEPEGLLVLVARRPRLRVRDLEEEGGQEPARLGGEGADRSRCAVSRERGEDPGVGRTEKPVTGFRSRAGRTFRAKLRLEQTDEGKWRVEFDEDWAKEPPAGQSEEERAEAEASGDGAKAGTAAAQAGDGAAAAKAGDGAASGGRRSRGGGRRRRRRARRARGSPAA